MQSRICAMVFSSWSPNTLSGAFWNSGACGRGDAAAASAAACSSRAASRYAHHAGMDRCPGRSMRLSGSRPAASASSRARASNGSGRAITPVSFLRSLLYDYDAVNPWILCILPPESNQGLGGHEKCENRKRLTCSYGSSLLPCRQAPAAAARPRLSIFSSSCLSAAVSCINSATDCRSFSLAASRYETRLIARHPVSESSRLRNCRLIIFEPAALVSITDTGFIRYCLHQPALNCFESNQRLSGSLAFFTDRRCFPPGKPLLVWHALGFPFYSVPA